jgi:hypothetical protein
MRWHIKENEIFNKTFFFNSKNCPKMADEKITRMKLFLRGICNKHCNRAHKLSPEDEQAFDDFVTRCHEGGASKPDFSVGGIVQSNQINTIAPLPHLSNIT